MLVMIYLLQDHSLTFLLDLIAAFLVLDTIVLNLLELQLIDLMDLLCYLFDAVSVDTTIGLDEGLEDLELVLLIERGEVASEGRWECCLVENMG